MSKRHTREQRKELIKNEIIHHTYNCMNKTNKVIRIEKRPSCYACRMDCPEQKYHMDIGGCMYEE